MIPNPDLLLAHPLFAALDDSGRADLVAQSDERQIEAGHLIVSEGALADSLFVVLEGSVMVFTARNAEPSRGRSQETVTLARLGAGEHFGEQALLPGGTGYRGASVCAMTKVRLAEVPAHLLRRLLVQAPQVEQDLLALGHEQLQRRMRLKSEAIRFLDFGADDLSRLGSEDFAPGQLLMRQGDPSDKLFLLVSGDVEVSEDQGARRRILHRLSAGQCVGELGLATGRPRSASVRALTRVETLTIAADHFHTLLQRSPGLRNHVRTLQRCLSLREEDGGAGSGFMTQYAGQLDGADCITTACRMDDGRHVVASLLVGAGTYHVGVTRPGPPAAASARSVRHPAEGEAACQLSLVADAQGQQRLESATASAGWPDVQRLHRLVLADTPWTDERVQDFVDHGRLPALPRAAAADDPDLLCACMRVSRQQAVHAVLTHCADLAELGRATGCGSVCGGCKPQLQALLGEPGCAPAALTAVHDLAPGIRALHLQPRRAASTAFLPGQHVWLEGWIGGHWVRRSYTLSAPPREDGTLELCVKLEPQGVLSPWLFERQPGDTGLRVSPPRGDGLPAAHATQPAAGLVGLVAGIGITPLLALWRDAAARGAPAPCVLHYSVRDRSRAAAVDELQQLARQHPALQLQLRETARQGRLGGHDVMALARAHPQAAFVVCGPEAYLGAVQAALRSAGVAPAQIHVQRFTPAGAAVPVAPPAAASAPPVWSRLGQAVKGLWGPRR